MTGEGLKWTPPPAEEALAEAGGTILRPSGKGQVSGGELGGYGGGMGLELRYHVDGDAVEIRTAARATRSVLLDVHGLVFDELAAVTGVHHDQIEFPLTLTIEQATTIIEIDGEPHEFAVITCGASAHVSAVIDGHRVAIKCPASRASQLSLTKASQSELAELLGASRQRFAHE